jgi:hypothetical protein
MRIYCINSRKCFIILRNASTSSSAQQSPRLEPAVWILKEASKCSAEAPHERREFQSLGPLEKQVDCFDSSSKPDFPFLFDFQLSNLTGSLWFRVARIIEVLAVEGVFCSTVCPSVRKWKMFCKRLFFLRKANWTLCTNFLLEESLS